MDIEEADEPRVTTGDLLCAGVESGAFWRRNRQQEKFPILLEFNRRVKQDVLKHIFTVAGLRSYICFWPNETHLAHVNSF